MAGLRRYRYVGPEDVRVRGGTGTDIRSAAALDAAGIPHPGGYTTPIIFRRCEGCGERNIVRDGDFTCAVCGDALPARWNF